MNKVKMPNKAEQKEPFQDEIFQKCLCCQQAFIARYWDVELEWYIDMNLSGFCKTCQRSNPS